MGPLGRGLPRSQEAPPRRVCYSRARTKGGFGLCPFHVAPFKIEIHLKWFGFLSSSPGVRCRETPSKAYGAARCLSLSVFTGTQRRHIKLNVSIRAAGWAPLGPAAVLRPWLPCWLTGRTSHLCFSEQPSLEDLEAPAGSPILYGPPFHSF